MATRRKSPNLFTRLFSLLGLLVFIAIVFFLVDKVNKKEDAVIVPESTAEETITPVSSDEIVHGDRTKKQIIFTFDGGGDASSIEKILLALSKHKVKGTFFLTGKFVELYPDVTKAIDAAGHEIFSHTYNHPHLTALSDEQIKGELDSMSAVLQVTIGKSPRPYFRAPYGDRDNRVRRVAAEDGYQSVYWTNDAMDWAESNGVTAEQTRNIILNSAAPGNIYLMHIGDSITGLILDDVLTTLEKRGFTMVPLTQGI